MQEVWAYVRGYEGQYLVSNMGRVKNSQTGRVLADRPNTSGHMAVSLCRGGREQSLLVHRLVAVAFLGLPPDGKPLALHRDDDHNNNAASNLYWGTHKDNRRDAFSNGHARMPDNRGSRNGQARLSEHDVIAIRQQSNAGVSTLLLAAYYGVSASTIRSVVNKSRWAWLTEVA